MRYVAFAFVVSVLGCSGGSGGGGGGGAVIPGPPGSPTIGLVTSSLNIRIWESVVFDARTTTGPGPITYAWTFGDSGASTGPEVAHQYWQTGVYTCTLSATNSNGTSTAQRVVNVAAESAPSMTYRSNFPLSGCGGLSGQGDLALVPRLSNGDMHIIDTSIATAPVQRSVVTTTGLMARETRCFGGHYMVGGSEPSVTDAWSITDIADPDAPVVIGTFGPGLTAAHTVGVWDNMVIINTSRSVAPQIQFYDVSDPTSPALVGSWSGSASAVHDCQRVGNKLYVAALYDGFWILDVSDIASITTLVHKPYSGAFTHNIWPSKTGSHVFTTDETTGGHLRVWSVDEIAGTAAEVGSYDPGTGSIIHNVVVVGDYAYIAHYTYGFVVLDVSTPATPVSIYHYDTYTPSDGSGYAGAWMVWPFGSKVYVSDISYGLYVFTK